MKISDMEDIIDRFIGEGGSIGDIFTMVVNSMFETAEHIRVNLQDEKEAKYWEKVANKIAAFSAKIKL